MSEPKRVVWILGAGFSRALGAPLLRDLFTDELGALVHRALVLGKTRTEALRCAPDEIAICPPGPTKMRLSEGPFSKLWDLARGRILGADHLVFVAYRFPPTDVLALDRLLNSIRQSKSPVVHTVLGPRVQSDDSERLVALLQATLPARSLFASREVGPPIIKRWPLYASDFMTAVRNDRLLRVGTGTD